MKNTKEILALGPIEEEVQTQEVQIDRWVF